jgi:hypothetical protein
MKDSNDKRYRGECLKNEQEKRTAGTRVALFEEKMVHRIWHNDEWYFSIDRYY